MYDTNKKEIWRCRIIDNKTNRPDEWLIDDEAVQAAMLDHCRHSATYNQSFTIDERDGYNGVQLFSEKESYIAFMGKMTHSADGKTELKTDLGRQLEQMVLLNAPAAYRSHALAILTIDFD